MSWFTERGYSGHRPSTPSFGLGAEQYFQEAHKALLPRQQMGPRSVGESQPDSRLRARFPPPPPPPVVLAATSRVSRSVAQLGELPAGPKLMRLHSKLEKEVDTMKASRY